MLGTNTDSGLTSLSWLAGCTLTVGALDADEQGTRCRRRFKRPSTHNRSSPYGATSNLPQYWATGGSKADFTEGGEELETSRPAFSFTCLIGLAILANRSAMVSVGKIYAYIQCNFPYFREAKSTWRNSVRHVLSLNKFFYKANAQAQAGRKQASARVKGGLWGVKPCMLRALLGLLEEARRTLPTATVQHLHLDSVRARCAKKQLRLTAAATDQQQQQQQQQQPVAAAALPAPVVLDLDAMSDSMSEGCASPTQAAVPDYTADYGWGASLHTDSCGSLASLFEDNLAAAFDGIGGIDGIDGMDSMSEASYDSFEDGWSSADEAHHDSADLMSLAGVDSADSQYMSSLMSSVQWPVHPEGPAAFSLF